MELFLNLGFLNNNSSILLGEMKLELTPKKQKHVADF